MLAEAYNFRGQLYFQMEDEVSAANDFSKSLKLDPGQARLYYNRAVAHQKLGQLQNAIEDLNEYIRLSPQADDNEAVAKQIANLEGQLDEVAN
jgi:regulator of sirC expression with transglutaminase-like and TPR domain